jgi:uncharacterized membrane protein YbhN (UPF0104 family)
LKLALRVLLSVAAAAVLLAALAHWGGVDAGEVAETLGRLKPSTWAAALAVHLGIYLARTRRFRALIPLDERPGFGPTFTISAAHNLAAYVLPVRTGEASLVLYLRALCGVSGRAALASLIVSRALDLATLAGALGAITLYLSTGEHWAGSREAGLLLGGGLFALTVVFALASVRGEWLVSGVGRALERFGVGRTGVGARLLARGEQFEQALQATRAGGRLSGAVLLSLVVWAGVFLFYAILARGLGLPERIGLPEAAFGSSLAVMTNVLPINAMAGFGTQEAGWVLGFEFLGVERELALSTGVAVHLVQLAHVVVFGGLAHLVMGFLGPRGGSVEGTGEVPPGGSGTPPLG